MVKDRVKELEKFKRDRELFKDHVAAMFRGFGFRVVRKDKVGKR